MKTMTWLAMGCAIFALAACDGGKSEKTKDDEAADDDDGAEKKKKKKKKKTDDDEGDSATAEKPAKDEEATAKVEPRVVCGALNQIPEIPAERSNPPSLEEWGTACDVNTQGAGSHPGDCTMKIKREWLQVSCRNAKGYEEFDSDGFGAEGLDHFKHVVPGQLVSFVVRLRKGKNPKVRMCRDKERASLFVSWPPSNSKPTIVALGVGPKCDGSNFGG
jgi:hypothetical protein